MILSIFAVICSLSIRDSLAGCSWGSWSSCNYPCGGGTRQRSGSCSGWLWSKHGSSETSTCNEFCHNGGRFSGGSCQCPVRRTGRCCDDYKPCSQSNGGCAETCQMVRQGSRTVSRCGCRHAGYQLSMDGRTCVDINECSLGRCDQNCNNTPGSFVCSCRIGYTLASDKTTCTDNNECTANATKCQHSCVNVPGSFRCSCRAGYRLDSNGYSCNDINECSVNNGGCSHTCVNEAGSYHCECPSGYSLESDGRTCQDVDECSGSHSTCSQLCVNTVGSYRCACNNGYQLAKNGINCEDIDDCVGVICQHGGRCLDGVASYTCSCPSAFTGIHCEQDVDECAGIYNGGCEETCINTMGSFRCECTGNKTLLPDGLFCSGGPQHLSVFRRHNIVRQLLPRGCSTVELTRCTEGINMRLTLSSTSSWYRLTANSSILFTQGIVFVELNDLSLPVSLTGMEIYKQSEEFTMTVGSLKYTPPDGIVLARNGSRQNCWSFAITPRDIHDFLTSVSFLKTFFDNFEKFLPDWLSFSYDGSDALKLLNLKTELLHGSDIENDPWCKGAPIRPTNLYSVFKFDGSLNIAIYGDKISLPKPLAGKRFCFLVDICQDYGGSVFLMLPEESRDLLESFEIFKNLKAKYDLEIRPRGIGLSLLRHINVHSQTTELQLWNGDRIFNYPIFPEANVWIGGDALMHYKVFDLKGRTDMFFKMPSPFKLLKSVFIDEWDLLMRTEVSADMAIKFKLHGSMHTLRFRDFGVANVDIYASLGGMQSRDWCGSHSNPPGMFLSMMVRVNPFRHIPILEDWVFDLSSRLYVFFMTDPSSKVSPVNNIDIMSDILQLDQILKSFTTLTITTANRYGILLQNESLAVVNDLKKSLNKTSVLVQDVMRTIHSAYGFLNLDLKRIGDSFATIWNDGWAMIKNDTKRFTDSIEYNSRIAKYNFTNLFWSEVNRVEQNLKSSIGKLTKQVFSALRDYDGLGFRFTATLHVLHLKIGEFELEAVHSVDRLGACSKFKDAFDIFKNERSFRLMGILSTALVKLGFFLHLDVGAGIGIAFSVDTPGKFLMQLHTQASILGISGSRDLLINNNGIYFDIEGKLWNVFLAKLNVSAAHGKDWNELTFHIHGELLANAGNDDNFQDSYIDALRKVIKNIGDSATNRITQAQNAITKAQSGLTSAQHWLEGKKSAVRSANSAFDSAVHALDRAKEALERAKSPFRAAIAKVNQAQRHLDSLCKIESCSRVCVPGIKCRICHKKVWFVRIPYPCCHFTSCMFSFPNPICVAKNIGCRAVRAVAYVALEAAKLLVRTPMLVLDAAKVAVSAAQVIVDKSRVVLDLAVAALDLAKLGLEGAKGILSGAKAVLEGVKVVVRIGLKIVDLILKYGLQSLIDVKNCNFDINISTRSLPVFAVGCEINAFSAGWRPIRFTVNFNRPIQSLWESAKSTIKAVIDSLGHAFFGRKKRELLHKALLKTHRTIRSYKHIDSDGDLTDIFLNETIDIIIQTAGYENTTFDEDYENRVAIFRRKCLQFRNIISFLNDANNVLFDIANETYTTIKAATDMHDQLDDFDLDKIRSNFSLENSGVDAEVAMREFNISGDDLAHALASANDSLKNDTLLTEIHNISQISKGYLNESTETAESVRILDQWILAMENVTSEYFEKETCVSFLDCAHFSIAELLDLYYAEEFDNVSDIFYLLSSIEDTFLELISNSSHPIRSVYHLSDTIRVQLNTLEDMNPYCSVPPTIVSPLTNQTTTTGGSVWFYCNVSGNPEPTIWWYHDDKYLPNEHSKNLLLQNVTNTNTTQKFKCIAGNVVANLSSDDAFLSVEDEIPDTAIVNGGYSKPRAVGNATAEPGVVTKKIPIDSNTNGTNDLRVILIPTLVLLVAFVVTVAAVLWRYYMRNKFRKDKNLGSFMSLNMVRPSSTKPLHRGGQPVSLTTVEQLR